MKVVFCAYDSPDYVGGPNAWLLRLLPALRNKGVDVHVLFFVHSETDAPTAAALQQKGINTPVFGFHKTTRKKIDWILSQVQEIQPQVFVPNLVIPAYYAAGWIRAAGIPTIGVLHSDDPFYHAILEEFAQGDFFSLSALVCVSNHLKAAAQNKAASDVTINKIPYGVPVPAETASRPDDKFRFIFAGRLEEEQKRISDVAQAFCSAANQIDGCEGLIFGAGPSARRVERIIEERDARHKVRLVGRVPSQQIQSFMLDSHVIVLLSEYEGLPIALMEGMACGLVPVCSRMESGIPELISHDHNGLIVEDRGESFVKAIVRLKNDPEYWQRLSLNARSTIEKDYGEEVCADKWLELIQSCTRSALSTPRLEMPKLGATQLPAQHPAFLREDFRVHHLIERARNKIRRWIAHE